MRTYAFGCSSCSDHVQLKPSWWVYKDAAARDNLGAYMRGRRFLWAEQAVGAHTSRQGDQSTSYAHQDTRTNLDARRRANKKRLDYFRELSRMGAEAQGERAWPTHRTGYMLQGVAAAK